MNDIKLLSHLQDLRPKLKPVSDLIPIVFNDINKLTADTAKEIVV